MFRVPRIADVYPPRIDAHDHRLRPVHLRYLLDARIATALAARLEERHRRTNSVAADGHLVRPRAEVLRGHLQRGVLLPVLVREAADAATNGKRHEAALARVAHHLEHRRVSEWEIAKTSDVQEGDLIGAVLEILLRERYGVPEVSHLAAVSLLAHVVLVALRHDEIASIVRAHVHACDEALR